MELYKFPFIIIIIIITIIEVFIYQAITSEKTKPAHTLRSLWRMGVWQWCKRDTASQTSQKIFNTSFSLNPVDRRSFINWITEPEK